MHILFVPCPIRLFLDLAAAFNSIYFLCTQQSTVHSIIIESWFNVFAS